MKKRVDKKGQGKGCMYFCETDEVIHPTFYCVASGELSEEVAI